MCAGKRIYGGFPMLATGTKTFLATYSNLPSNYTVLVRNLFYMLDDW